MDAIDPGATAAKFYAHMSSLCLGCIWQPKRWLKQIAFMKHNPYKHTRQLYLNLLGVLVHPRSQRDLLLSDAVHLILALQQFLGKIGDLQQSTSLLVWGVLGCLHGYSAYRE